MKQVEKYISQFVERQFPSFYREEGDQFVSFVKAYYEWLENDTQELVLEDVTGFNVGDTISQTLETSTIVTGTILSKDVDTKTIKVSRDSKEYFRCVVRCKVIAVLNNEATGAQTFITTSSQGGVLHQARSLPSYRDIDETTDRFVVNFKEKYLKNIQFDTASNKKLLVKNSLDLYRSKGTERSIDLFFKLVYGTSAEVRYPAEQILRPSDGIYEKPEYLEVTFSQFNIDYVGKQVIGQLSGAKAFVEKYIRRRVGRGFVNLLYISGRQGDFQNGEVIGINVNNSPVYQVSKRAKLIGSVKRVTIETKGRDFAVGDIVKFVNSDRGVGGLARVESVSAATGIVDFIFVDGGYGYTLNSQALVSEKVLALQNIKSDYYSGQYTRLFEQIVQPVINVAFSSATSNLIVGETVYKYDANGSVVAQGRIIDVDNIENEVTISHTSGVFTPSTTYYVDTNTKNFAATTLIDRTIGGKVMGIPETYTITLSGQRGELAVGQNVYQQNTSTQFAYGTVNSITSTETGNVVVLTSARGAFKNSKFMSDFSYTAGTGTITTLTTSQNVTGTSTLFNNNYIGATLYSPSNVAIGIVNNIVSPTSLVLVSNASVAVTSNAHSYGRGFLLTVASNTSITANVEEVSASFGLHDIRRFVNTLRYNTANNNDVVYGEEIYAYNTTGNVVAEGVVLTVDHDSGTSSGNLTFIPIKGYFTETTTVYTSGNVSSFVVETYSTSNTGGDYTRAYPSRVYAPVSNTTANLTSISFGSGAEFGVGTIGETEVIFIGTDIISSNNIGPLDTKRYQLSVSSATGFNVGDAVAQEINKVAFNPSANLNPSTGFIQLPNANTIFTVGDNLRYAIAAGNTAVNGMIPGDYYHVRFANTTGVILSYPYRKTDQINTSNFSYFANNVVNEDGHYLYKTAIGTVYTTSTGTLRVKDPIHNFGNTGGTANTTTTANGNIVKYLAPTTNTAITNISGLPWVVQANQPYASLQTRAAAFGFPKNPLGDLMDTIYSCLTFGRFEIGIIGSLNQVNPGQDYNTDPYVLAYQPYISSFDRKDFDIVIKNPTRTYLVGERVQQTLANLVYYDLKVSTGVFGNTYDEKSSTVNTKDEVLSGSDFIYFASNTVTINSSDDIDNDADFIRVTGDNPFKKDEVVRYWTDTGNTVISGLSNNTFYFVSYANTTGIKLAATAGGANLTINAASNVQSFDSNNVTGNFILLSSANTYFNNGDRVRYYTAAGNTALNALSNNSLYYVVYANSTGLALSATSGGANLAIAGQNPGDVGHYLRYYNPNYVGHNIRNYVNQFEDGQKILYLVPASNSALSGLTSNTSYFVVDSNTSGFKVSSTFGGGAIDITSSGSAEDHTFRTLPGYLPGDRVYQNTVPIVNATVQSVYTIGSNNFVRIAGNTAPITNNIVLYSYTSPAANGLVSNVSLYQVTATAKGIVKAGSNNSVLKVKRITFENTFIAGQQIIGEVSGASANIVSIAEDMNELYPIGLNADIQANVTIANGQVTSLQVIDSGFAYTNSEIVDFVSEDNLRAGTAKMINDGHGLGKGFYRSSKGFLSEDMYIHDGDYYQEYSYEILSKISVDRYADMFKKVMHQAGTKFFGSALVVEEANVALSVSSISTAQEISFNASLDVSTVDDYIELDIPGETYQFVGGGVNQESEFITLTNNPYYNAQKLEVNDYVKYTSNTIDTYGAIGIGDGVSTVSNNSYWYVAFANSSGVKLSSTRGGLILNLNTASVTNTLSLHYLTKYINPFSNGDQVYYTTATGNTVVSGLANATNYYVVNTTPLTVKLSTTAGGAPINITASGTSEIGHYLTKTVEE